MKKTNQKPLLRKESPPKVALDSFGESFRTKESSEGVHSDNATFGLTSPLGRKWAQQITVFHVLMLVFLFPPDGGIKGGCQNIAINTTGNPANTKALLDIDASPGNNLGLLIPRLTTTERNNIASPPAGLLIYNTNTKCIEFFDGVWQSANCACSVAPAVPDAISGPAAVCASTNGVLYSISSVPTATSYTWTVPAGLGTIASGQGSTSITVILKTG